jgi:hypothetical protein
MLNSASRRLLAWAFPMVQSHANAALMSYGTDVLASEPTSNRIFSKLSGTNTASSSELVRIMKSDEYLNQKAQQDGTCR